jgi:hypothetical protein
MLSGMRGILVAGKSKILTTEVTEEHGVERIDPAGSAWIYGAMIL